MKKNPIKIDLQIAPRFKDGLPSIYSFKKWVKGALLKLRPIVLTIRLVDRSESAKLNWRYRKKKGATNVLAFTYNLPSALPKNLTSILHGDLVICIPIAKQEAHKQHKTLKAHCAHLTIHGVLHILGYTHNNHVNAKVMEDLEIKILKTLHFPNPYSF
jgi:probable rRNA maturation factor